MKVSLFTKCSELISVIDFAVMQALALKEATNTNTSNTSRVDQTFTTTFYFIICAICLFEIICILCFQRERYSSSISTPTPTGFNKVGIVGIICTILCCCQIGNVIFFFNELPPSLWYFGFLLIVDFIPSLPKRQIYESNVVCRPLFFDEVDQSCLSKWGRKSKNEAQCTDEAII